MNAALAAYDSIHAGPRSAVRMGSDKISLAASGLSFFRKVSFCTFLQAERRPGSRLPTPVPLPARPPALPPWGKKRAVRWRAVVAPHQAFS